MLVRSRRYLVDRRQTEVGMVEFKHDQEADALYVTLSVEPYAYGEELDAERRVDYSASGKPIGVELLCVSEGVDLRDLPEQKVIAGVLSTLKIRVLAS